MINARTLSLLGATPLLAWYVWGLTEQLPLFIEHCIALSTSTNVSGTLALEAVAQAMSITFTSFLLTLLLVREVPRTRVQGAIPYAATYIGTFAASTFFLLPSASLSIGLFATATTCIVVGFGLSIYALIYLGRSFAILPSTRTLVTDGPYRLVRHPLYLFEEIAIIGIMLQFAQPLSLVILGVHFVAQLTRMHYEERALTLAFPKYTSYASRTARLIPGIY